MKIELYQRVCLTVDIPEHHLKTGDLATVVEKIPGNPETNGQDGFALEVLAAAGNSVAVVFVAASAVRRLSEKEILHARQLADAL